jgi:hypothetical protein
MRQQYACRCGGNFTEFLDYQDHVNSCYITTREKLAYLVIIEYCDYYCPENEGGFDDVEVFHSKEAAENYMNEKLKTRIKDNRSYYIVEKKFI